MNITISDEWHDIKEVDIRKTPDTIFIDVPADKTSEDILKTIKVVISQLVKTKKRPANS